MMAILGWIIFGLVVGIIARFLMPGPQPMGFILTSLVGIAGSFVGGMIGSLIHGGGFNINEPSGWLGSIIGAILLLFGYSMVSKRM
jgi:uncharacterized membrane protein YeaQ/YmgE (transglycosylase-associated protein family)